MVDITGRALVWSLALAALGSVPLPASAHPVEVCDAETVFPSSAAWMMPAGRTYSYALPPRYFAGIFAGGPIDVTLYTDGACEIDPSCHMHGALGVITCSTARWATVEIHNPSAATVPLYLAIGQCTGLDLCSVV